MAKWVLLAACVALAACGGGGGGDDSGDGAAPATTSAVVAPAPPDETDAFTTALSAELSGTGLGPDDVEQLAGSGDRACRELRSPEARPALPEAVSSFQRVVLDTVMTEIDLVADEETGGQVLRLAAQHLCPEHTSTIGLYLGD